MLRLIPLLVLPIGLYNLFAFGGILASHEPIQAIAADTFSFTITMFSGDHWTISLGDFMVLFGIVMLFIEVVKATRTTSKELINHGLSMVVFVAALIEFIVLKGFATSTFFFLMLLSLFDVVAGYTISIVAASTIWGWAGPARIRASDVPTVIPGEDRAPGARSEGREPRWGTADLRAKHRGTGKAAAPLSPSPRSADGAARPGMTAHPIP